MRTALIIAHGSDEGKNGDAAEMHARRLEGMLGTRVRHIYKNCGEEEVRNTLSYLSRGDVEEVVVIPLFFASGMFSEKVVPKMIGLGEGNRGGTVEVDGKCVRVRVASPFGTDPHMRGVIGSVLGQYSAEPDRTAVMPIGHGSKDGVNSRTVEYNAGIVSELGFDAFPCYNEMNEPTVEQALRRVLDEGFDDILAIPLFVSSSHHSVVEIPEKLGLEEGSRERTFEHNGRTVSLRYSTEIGLEPGITDILYKMVVR